MISIFIDVRTEVASSSEFWLVFADEAGVSVLVGISAELARKIMIETNIMLFFTYFSNRSKEHCGFPQTLD